MMPKAAKAANGRLPDWVGAGEVAVAVATVVVTSAVTLAGEPAASGAVAFACWAVVFAAASGTRVTGISTVSFFAGTDVMFAV